MSEYLSELKVEFILKLFIKNFSMKSILTSFFLLTCFVINVFSQDQPVGPRHGIGLGGGWGAPYGFGAEYSYLITPNLDMNLGAGFSFSGLRTGFGSRYFFIKDKSSPFFSVNYIYTSGLSNLEVDIDNRAGEYKIHEDQALFVRGGYSIKAGDVLFIINVGYGFPFDEKDAEFRRGNYSSKQQDFANLMALGGIEVSGSIIIRFGKKNN